MAADATTVPTSAARRFRPEIQGLRTLAAGLVGIYHIWFDRVSGGVDVFFVVSGFLITGSILGSLERTGSIRFGAHLSRVARRIVPAAYVVLVVSMILTTAVISRVYWEETLREIVAAALYVVNWQFAASSVDYLANDEFQSPVLHFWALSVQGQFYVVWPLMLAVAGMIARRRGVSLRTTAIGVISVLVTVSFTYSVVRTAGNQVSAYFDSAARIWEFGLGGLTALLFTSVVVPAWAARVISAVGLAMILGTGVVLECRAASPDGRR
jgi:peptidoglycan/LPS O-acetylase OafA/YrhL